MKKSQALLGRRGRPFAESDSDELYEGSLPYRSLANRAASAVIEGLKPSRGKSAEGLIVARAAANASAAIAELLSPTAQAKSRWYYHPAVILQWVVSLSQWHDPVGRDAAKVLDQEELLPDPVVLSALARAWSTVAPRGVSAWSSFARKLKAIADQWPHWWQRNVFAHVPPRRVAVRGFPLTAITVRIPIGTRAVRGSRGTYFAAASAKAVRLDFTSEEAQKRLGEVWIAFTQRALYLVTTRGRRVTHEDLLALINSGTETSASVPAVAGESERYLSPRLPDSLAQRLAAAKSVKSTESATVIDRIN